MLHVPDYTLARRAIDCFDESANIWKCRVKYREDLSPHASHVLHGTELTSARLSPALQAAWEAWRSSKAGKSPCSTREGRHGLTSQPTTKRSRALSSPHHS